MSKKQDAFYFQNFIACAELSCKAAHMLRQSLDEFRPDTVQQKLDELHVVEHQADEKKHEILDRLSRAFIAPIEREDIVLLSQNIDNITDKLEDVLIRLYINSVDIIRPDALKLTDLVISCCEEVRILLVEFADFRHSRKLKDSIVRINALEEEADKLFISSMRSLHEEKGDVLHILAWREIYEYLERCADTCEHVADVVESVVMKNS